MNRNKSNTELIKHKNEAKNIFDIFLNKLISSEDSVDQSKADKICYWIKEYINYLDFESIFKPEKYKRYFRGEIIKVALGFNIGNEEGGLHYAVVVDVDNSIYNGVLTIIPLTSVKPLTNLQSLKRGSLFLGNELFTTISAKYHALHGSCSTELNELKSFISASSPSECAEANQHLTERIKKLENNLFLLKRMKHEIDNMKTGSIALISQITTISKIRIYDPKTNADILSGVKLSNEALDAIDNCILKLFTKNNTKKTIDK